MQFNYSVFYRYGPRTEEVKLAVVLCGDRLNQTLVTLKSALIFSKKNLHFIMIVDDVNRDILKNKVSQIFSFSLSLSLFPLPKR